MSTCASCGGMLPDDARFCPSCGRSIQVAGGDERRPVTILFADLVGSTALAETTDPEAWKATVDAALGRFSAAVDRHGGTVAQLLGDGLLAFFGAPVAHEDDPLRAVRTATEIVAEARENVSGMQGRRAASVAESRDPAQPGGRRLQVRVGLSTGEVVVGAIGGVAHREYLAVGDAVNVAARLQAAARPGTVLATEDTYALVATAVEASPRQGLVLKGKSAAVDAWEIHSVRPGTARVSRPGPAGRSVGRDAELRQLLDAADGLRRGAGAVVTVVGEPGLGKTRLLSDWHGLVGPTGIAWREAGCVTEGGDVPYGLARSLVRALLDVAPDADVGAVARCARDAARRLPRLDDADALLDRLLELGGEPGALAGLDARAVRHRTGRLLRALLEDQVRDGPAVLVVEDAHWIDPSSAELLAEALDAVPPVPIAVCLTMRPQGGAGLDRLRDAVAALPPDALHEIVLRPLTADEQRRLVREVLAARGGRARPGTIESPEELRVLDALVLDRSDGNPLFLEELVRAAAGDGSAFLEPRAKRDAVPLAPASVPRSLQGILLARVDALPAPVRRLVRVGAVIGREFSFDVARSVLVASGGEPPARADVVLAADGLLEPPASGRGDRFAFRHALVHDAAYASLVRTQRRELHGHVGRVLEAGAAPDAREGALAATLARHFALGEVHDAALRYAEMAARRAAAGYANAEAIELYSTAIDACRALLAATDPAIRATLTARLVELLDGRAWLIRLDGRYPEAEAMFREASGLVAPGPSLERVRWLLKLATCAGDRQAWKEVHELQLSALQMLEDLGGDRDLAWWRAWIEVQGERGTQAYWEGRTAELEAILSSLDAPVHDWGTAKQQADFEGLTIQYLHRRDCFMPSPEVGPHARAYVDAESRAGDRGDLAWATFTLGFSALWDLDLQTAERALREAIAEGEHLGDILLVARAVTYLSVALRRAGRVADTAETVDRVIELARRLGIGQYVAIALGNRAWTWIRRGDWAAARQDAEVAEQTWPPIPPMPLHWIVLWPAIAAAAAEGRPLDALARCRALLDRSQQPLVEPVAGAVAAVVEAGDEPGRLGAALERALAEARAAAYL